MSASAADPLEVELPDGVLSFDGRVVEVFGFRTPDARRIHIKHVKKVGLSTGRFAGGLVQVDGHGGTAVVANANPPDDRVPEVEAWMQAVRDAAPNLKE